MLNKGDKIGEYTLLEKVGSGGFGDVWKAEKRTALDVNYFALKFFRPKDDRLDFDRIGKELSVWKQLRGLGNIISVIELDRFDDYVYVVSDFADGGSLENWLKDNGGKAPSEVQAVRITLQILTGLENLHEKGFVHRDLKPDNILLMNGKFCLADFGVSREVKTYSKATGTAGTVEYMPPEAFEKSPPVTPQTDIWAIGVILQKLLTGNLPFPHEMPALMLAILQDEPDPMPETVPEGLREIVKKALQKKREDRFQTAREMIEALNNPIQFLATIAQEKTQVIIDRDFDKTKAFDTDKTQDWQAIEAEKLRQAEQARLQREAEEKWIQKEAIERERERQFREMEAEKERQRLRALQEEEARRQQSQATQFRPDYESNKSTDWKWILGILGGIALLIIIVPVGFLGLALIFGGKKPPANNSNQNINYKLTNSGNYNSNSPNRVANTNTNSSNTSTKSADDYFNLAYSCGEKKDYECAIQNYSKAIELQPSNSAAYNNRGNIYYYKANYDQSIKDYDKAIEIKPDYAEAYNNRGNSYYSKGYYDQSIVDAGRAIELKPEYAEAFVVRGNGYDGKGDYDQAIADYRRAIQINPSYQLAKDNLELTLKKKYNNLKK